MSDKLVKTRIKQKRATSAEWTALDPVLLYGEFIIVDTNSGDVRFKVGDGTSKYSQLPFTDELVRSQVSSHVHDDRYYTETEIDTKLTSKSDTTHKHDDLYDELGAASAVESTLNGTINAHTTNTDVHVTTSNKTNWNTAYTHSQATHARNDATKVEASTTNGNIRINGSESNVYTHPTSGITAGTYRSVTVDTQGHVTAGTNPTTLAGYGITDAETKTDASAKLTEAKTYTDTKTSGLASTTSVTTNISNHNTSTSSHSDIRSSISDLTTKLNNFLDVDDTTTDQLSEVITLINNNKGTLESLTTSKINVSDIVNNLTTNNSNKVLSAAQGVVIQNLIDEIEEAVSTKAETSAVTSHTGNTTYHITSTERTNWNAAKTHADSDHAPSNAEKNQNAFSNVTVGSTTIAADTATDTLTFVAGNNVTITPDATNDKITISATDTVYTHPTHTSRTSGLYKITVDSSGHVSEATAVAKSDITALGIPAQDTVYTHPTTHAASMITGLATVATSGSYNDLSNKPTIPAAYNHPTYTSRTSGLYKITVDGTGHISSATAVAKSDITALGIPAQDTTYTLSSFGITATATELNYTDGVTSNIQTQLNEKVPTSRTVNGKALSGNITLSASDVNAYSKTEVDSFVSGAKVTWQTF